MASAQTCANPPRALLRYIVISAVIVVMAFAIVGIYVNRERIAIRIKSVYAPAPPKAAQTPPPSKRKPGAFAGDAPWALSALPECFSEQSKTTGPPKYVLAHVPKGVSMVRPPQELRYADCTLRIEGETVYVDRGRDRMRIPPPARVYVAPGRLALLRGADGGYELRVYETKQ